MGDWPFVNNDSNPTNALVRAFAPCLTARRRSTDPSSEPPSATFCKSTDRSPSAIRDVLVNLLALDHQWHT